MASKGGFEGDVGFVEGKLRTAAARSRDIAFNLEQATGAFANFAKSAEKADQKMRDIASRMEKLNGLGDRAGFDKLGKQFRALGAQRSGLKFLDLLDKGFSRITMSITKLGSGLIAGVFNFLVDSIKRVYELQERWTRAIGGFNMKIGGMTAGLRQAQRAATAWSGTIRGLTNGDIVEGIQMFEEFTMAMSRVVKQGDPLSKFGLQLARGFNLGGEGAGRLADSFENMDMVMRDMHGTMSELIDSANLVGVPVNQLTADVLEANTYMARFGKEGAKGFVTAAGYARKFSMSMRELQAATEKLDLFDESAQTAAKLNATFGTLINSVDLMLMDDPAQRMESIRQSFIAQGRTYDTLSVKERRFAAETLGVNEQQLSSLLSLKNAGFSYQELMEQQQAKEAKESDAKRRMEIQLRKTAQTMYAFGAAFDRITVAIAKAIRPLLEVLGLAKTGGKDFKSFGQVMGAITDHIVAFFESLAGNAKWQAFMRALAQGVRDVASAVGAFIMDGRAAKWAGELAGYLHDVYDWGKKAFSFMLEVGKLLAPVMKLVVGHMKEAAMIWVGFQGLKLAGGIAGNLKSIGSLMGPAWNAGAARSSTSGGLVAAPGGSVGPVYNAEGEQVNNDAAMWAAEKARGPGGKLRIGGALKGAAAMGLGGAALALASGGSVGEAVGGGLGTAVGTIFGGPVGGAIGGLIGTYGGKYVMDLFKGPRSPLEKARDELAAQLKRETRQREVFEGALDAAKSSQAARDKERRRENSELADLGRRAKKTKGDELTLSAAELEMLRSQIKEFELFAKGNRQATGAVEALKDGTKTLTDDQIKALISVSKDYEKQLTGLRTVSEQLLSQELGKVEMARLKAKTEGSEAELKLLKSKRDQLTQTPADAESRAFMKGFEELQKKDFGPGQAGIDAYGEALGELAKEAGLDEELGGKLARFANKGEVALNQQLSMLKYEKKANDMDAEIIKLEKKTSENRMRLDEQMYRAQFRSIIGGDEAFLEFIRQVKTGVWAGAGLNAASSREQMFEKYLQYKGGAIKDQYGDSFYNIATSKPMAAGGVVMRPTRALIGEAGPEAVIPLRALARGRGPASRTGMGARTAANMASGGGSTRIQVVTSDVHIDGTKVGRALTRLAISSAEA